MSFTLSALCLVVGWRVSNLKQILQIVDPCVSAPLTSFPAVGIVRRFNACLPYKGHSPSDAVALECKLLKDIAKKVVSQYPRAPTLEQRCGLVTLAAMMDMEIVRDVINALGAQFSAAVTVRLACACWDLEWRRLPVSCLRYCHGAARAGEGAVYACRACVTVTVLLRARCHTFKPRRRTFKPRRCILHRAGGAS